MADAYVERRIGSKEPVYVTATGEADLTVQASPAPTVTLYDDTEMPVSGVNAVPTDGYDATPATEVNLWYNLDTADLVEGWYRLKFLYNLSAGDGMIRKEVSVVAILLLDPLVD
jgi:hypothetical protein